MFAGESVGIFNLSTGDDEIVECCAGFVGVAEHVFGFGESEVHLGATEWMRTVEAVAFERIVAFPLGEARSGYVVALDEHSIEADIVAFADVVLVIVAQIYLGCGCVVYRVTCLEVVVEVPDRRSILFA